MKQKQKQKQNKKNCSIQTIGKFKRQNGNGNGNEQSISCESVGKNGHWHSKRQTVDKLGINDWKLYFYCSQLKQQRLNSIATGFSSVYFFILIRVNERKAKLYRKLKKKKIVRSSNLTWFDKYFAVKLLPIFPIFNSFNRFVFTLTW